MSPTFSPTTFFKSGISFFTGLLAFVLSFAVIQDVQAQTGCSIIKTGCPPANLVSPLCATHEVGGVLGANVSWTPPSFALSCPGEGGSGYAFNMEFDLNESLSAAGCWEYNKVQRVGTDGGKLRLWQSVGTGNPWVKTPGFYLTGTTNLQLTIYAVENFTVNVYLINTTTLVETLVTTTPTLSIIGNSTVTNYPFTITPPAPGGYKFRFEFVGGSSNANEVQVLSINATVLGGCTGDVNFVTTSNVNPGSFFQTGCTNVTYTATCNSCTSPGPLTETCTFQVCVNGIKASITNNTPTNCGLSNGTVTFDTTVSAVSANANALQYSIDGGPWTTISSPLTITGLSGGAHTLNIQAYFDNISGYCAILAPINFNITVGLDVTDPDITCPVPAASYNTSPGVCTSSQTFTATATDVCDPSPAITYFIGVTPISFPYAFPVGTTTVTAVATDAAANTDECTFDVEVVDNQAPTLTGTLPSGASSQNLCYTNIPAGPTEAAIMALYSDNCNGVITVTKSGTPTGDNCSWSVTYTYEVKDQYDNIVSPSPTVTYSGSDQTDPNLKAGQSVPTGGTGINACVAPAGPTEAAIQALYEDNCGGAVTVVKSGSPTGNSCGWSVTYSYSIKDACNNETIATVTYSGSDQTDPNLKAGQSVPTGGTGINACVAPAGPTEAAIQALYEDNCGGAVTVVKSGSPTGNSCGWSVTYSYSIKDACNNETIATVTYSGSDQTDPNLKAGQSVPTGGTGINACVAPAGPTEAAIQALYEDNCGGAVTVVKSGSPTGNSCGWSVTYSYSIKDACNNETIATVTYSGSDQTDPNLKAGQSVPTGGTGINACVAPAGPTQAAIQALYEDNCGGAVTVVKSGSPTGNSCGWSVTYSYSIKDACNNETIATVTYSGSDQTDPNLKAGQSVPTGGTGINACVAPAGPTEAAIQALYEDNCGGAVTVVKSGSPTGNSCGWSVTYSYSIKDACNNETIATVTYSGSDQTDPNLKAGQSVPTGGTGINACVAPAGPTEAAIQALYEDNCGGAVTVVKSGSPTGNSCGWSVTYSYSIKDACNNETIATVTYSGSDQTDPNLKAGQSVPTGGTGINACVAPAGPTEAAIQALYEDNCGGAVTVVKSGSPTGNSCGWSVTYSYSIKDACNNETIATVTYSGSDQTDPNLKAGQSVPTGGTGINACVAPAGPTEAAIQALYEDNCGGAVTVVKSGSPTGNSCGWSVTYSYSIKDACNNETIATVTYSGSDQTDPTGTAPAGAANINACFVSTSVAPAGVPAFNPATADDGYTDNCGGVVTATLTNTSITGTNCSWSVVYTFKVADACGNELTGQTITYTGGDKTAPTGSAPAGAANINACFVSTSLVPAGVPAFNPATADDGYSDNCGVVTATLTNTSITGNNCSWSVVYTFKVADACGNELTGRTITYTGGDKTAPTGTAPAGTSNINACFVSTSVAPAGVPAFDPLTADNGYTDNCGGVVTATLTNTTISGNNAAWSVVYTFKVADACGNELLGQTITHTGKNQTKPTITACATNSSASAGAGCTAPVPNFAVTTTATSPCGAQVVFTKTQSPAAGTNVGVGVHTITITVTDDAGNFATCTATFTVSDNTAPNMTCPANITTPDDGCGTAIVEITAPNATDNCTGAVTPVGVRSDELPLTAPYPIGVTTITWTATDATNHTTTCTQTITITKSEGTIIANYTFVGFTAYPFNANETAPGISSNVTATEPFAYTGSGTTTGPAAFKVNAGTNEALVLQPSSGNNTRYIQFVVSGATLKYYSEFKVYLQAERQPQGATMITLAYSKDNVTYTNVGTLAIPDQTTWYEKVFDLSTIAALNGFDLTTLYFRVYASGSDANGSSDATRLEIDNFQVFAAGVGPIITCPANQTVTVGSAADCFATVNPGTATGAGRCGTPNISSLRSDAKPLTDPYPIGVTTITWKATDENGVFTTCVQTITVNGLIDAQDDFFGAPVGGGIAGNALGNDYLNCQVPSPAQLIITIVTPPSTPNIVLNAAGEVNVANGTASGNYTIVYQICDAANPTKCDQATITINIDVSTPVTGLQLKGNRNGPDVHLNWSTLTEQNTSHFIMERSFDGVRFEPLNNRIPAAGNSAAHRTYNLVDKNVLGSVVYYRVKMYDNNGQMKMSNLVAITLNVSKQLRVYPNPVNDFVTIEFAVPGNYQVDLISDNGQLVLVQKDIQVTNSFRTLTMQRNNLVSGQYQMRIWNKTTGKVDIIRLVYLPKLNP